MFEETGCDAVMLGRPALRNPWIFRQISELLAGREPYRPTGVDLAGHFLRLTKALGSREPDTCNPLGPLKEQLGYLCRSVRDGAALQRRLQRLTTLELFLEATEEAFSALPMEEIDLGARAAPLPAVSAAGSVVDSP